ncbi:MAG: DUF6049 family protein [Mycobacteriales bacterium]
MTGVRRTPARAVRLVLGGLLLAAVLSLGGGASGLPGSAPGQARAATPTPTPSGGRTVEVAVDELTPKAPARGQQLRVSGRLVNHGSERVEGLRVAIQVGTVLTNRSALQGASTSPPSYPREVGTPARPLEPLAPRASLPFTVTVPLDEVHLDRLGVYPLRIEVRGRAAGRTSRQLGSADTFLPSFPDPISTPTRLAWVWPLVDAPHWGAGDTFTDDDLAASLSGSGRLRGLLSAAGAAVGTPASSPGASPAAAPGPTPGAGQPSAGGAGPAVPVTFALDPDLLETVGAMSAPYLVSDERGKTRPGSGTAAATSWLARLAAATRGAAVLELPYADPDVVALTRAGLDVDVLSAVSYGGTVAPRLLPGSTALTGLSWPPAGMLTVSGLDTVVGSGTTSLLLSDDALPLVDPPYYTPGPRATVGTVGRRIDVLLSDSSLDQLLARGTDGGGARLAEQRFLVETAMITAERQESRSVVVTPPRRWAPDPAYAAAVLADTAAVPWLTPTTVPSVLHEPVPSGSRMSLTYPERAGAAELGPAYLDGVDRIRGSLRQFRSILTNDAATTPIQLALLRTESAAWRDDPAGGISLRNRTGRYLAALRDQVRVTTGGVVTLTSSSGTIPVTIANDLDQPIRVQLRLDAKDRARLGTDATDVQQVAAKRRQTIEVHAQARTSGQFPVYVTLLTPDGESLGPRVELLVRSTAYGRVALGITGTAFGVLLLAVVARLGRRARRARQATTAPTTAT